MRLARPAVVGTDAGDESTAPGWHIVGITKELANLMATSKSVGRVNQVSSRVDAKRANISTLATRVQSVQGDRLAALLSNKIIVVVVVVVCGIVIAVAAAVVHACWGCLVAMRICVVRLVSLIAGQFHHRLARHDECLANGLLAIVELIVVARVQWARLGFRAGQLVASQTQLLLAKLILLLDTISWTRKHSAEIWLLLGQLAKSLERFGPSCCWFVCACICIRRWTRWRSGANHRALLLLIITGCPFKILSSFSLISGTDKVPLLVRNWLMREAATVITWRRPLGFLLLYPRLGRRRGGGLMVFQFVIVATKLLLLLLEQLLLQRFDMTRCLILVEGEVSLSPFLLFHVNKLPLARLAIGLIGIAWLLRLLAEGRHSLVAGSHSCGRHGL